MFFPEQVFICLKAMIVSIDTNRFKSKDEALEHVKYFRTPTSGARLADSKPVIDYFCGLYYLLLNNRIIDDEYNGIVINICQGNNFNNLKHASLRNIGEVKDFLDNGVFNLTKVNLRA